MSKQASAVVIDKGVPMPARGGITGSRYPWGNMEVGDSILIPPDVRMNTGLVNVRYAPKRFSGRKTPDGYRIWRTA